MKKYIILLFTILLIFSLSTPILAQTNHSPNPLLPLREVGESLGYSLKWNNDTKEAIVFDMDGNYAILQPDNHIITVSGTGYVYLPIAPKMYNNTLFAPINFWESAFNLDVIIRDGNMVIQRK